MGRRRQLAETGAWLEFGRRRWRWFVFWPAVRFVLRTLGVLAVVVGGGLAVTWLWVAVPHQTLAVVGITAGAFVVAGLMVYRSAQTSVWGARLSIRRGRYLRRALLFLALTGAVVAAVLMYRTGVFR